MDIKRVTSPGGLEAWLAESHDNPLIAMRFAFRGGAAQDPKDKQGLAYYVSGMMDEGAGNLDSVAFQERLQSLAMRMDFDASRDVMLGNVQMLTANKDESFDLLRLAVAEPRFDADAVERVRAQRSPIVAEEVLRPAERELEALMLSLRTPRGVPVASLPDAEELAGLVERDDTSARLTVRGRLLADLVSSHLRVRSDAEHATSAGVAVAPGTIPRDA